MARKKITRCPHCGSDEGVFTKTTFVNVPCYLKFNGEEMDNTEMYDNAEDVRGGAMVYCRSCRKTVCRLSTIMEQWKGVV